MEGNNNAERVKVVFIGEYGVGKTSIILQYTTNKFDPDNVSSLGCGFSSKTMEFLNVQKAIKFEIWDPPGYEKYRAIPKIYYKDARAIILVYDITNKLSFDAIKEYWNDEINKYKVDNAILSVVANKSDLYENSEVSNEEGKRYAQKIGAIFQATSAKSNSGITALFENIGQRYFNPNFDISSNEKKRVKESKRKKKLEGNYFRKKKKYLFKK